MIQTWVNSTPVPVKILTNNTMTNQTLQAKILTCMSDFVPIFTDHHLRKVVQAGAALSRSASGGTSSRNIGPSKTGGDERPVWRFCLHREEA